MEKHNGGGIQMENNQNNYMINFIDYCYMVKQTSLL